MGFVSRLRQQLSIEEEEEAAAASQRQNHVITESQRRSSMDVAAPVLFDLNPIDPALAAAATAPATHS
jgi:hypothetical protein